MNYPYHDEDRDPQDNRRLIGYILLGIAAYIVLVRTGIADALGLSSLVSFAFDSIFALIPAACVALGALWLSRAESGRKPMMAWCLICVGSILLISQFELFGLDFGELIFPAILVAVAFTFINKSSAFPKGFGPGASHYDPDDPAINLFAFMGGGEMRYTSQNLIGGEVSAFMGGYQLDFRDAEMEGDYMVIDLYCIMGGCEITVPPHWEVEKQLFSIMGGFSVKAACMADKLEMPRKRLVLRGCAIMGGGEVKN